MQAERAATVQGLSARKAQLQADLNAMASRQTDEPGLAAEQERLDRDYQVLKTQYDKMLAEREEIRRPGDLKSETGSGQLRLVNPPSLPTAPASHTQPPPAVGGSVPGPGAGMGSNVAADSG